jgi:hypothetical protein
MKMDNEQEISKKLNSIVDYLYKTFEMLEEGEYEFPLNITLDSNKRIIEITIRRPSAFISKALPLGARVVFCTAPIPESCFLYCSYS